jgi:hypothetical protein
MLKGYWVLDVIQLKPTVHEGNVGMKIFVQCRKKSKKKELPIWQLFFKGHIILRNVLIEVVQRFPLVRSSTTDRVFHSLR